MDILKPELIWVDGRCYRVLENIERTDARDIPPYFEDNNYNLDDKDSEDEYYDTDIEIVPYGSTRFKHTFRAPKAFFPYIIGAKHAVRKRLESETGTLIQIPKLGQDGDIVIIGSDHKRIITARRRINLLMEATRKKLEFTHFLSIPLNEGHIIMKFNMFKNEVLTNSGKKSRGVDETIFQTPSKLHLTIGLMTLLDETERNKAIEALNYCNEHIVRPAIEKYGQIPIHLQGIDIMQDDPSEAKVIYAKIVNKTEVLQKIVDEIVDYYVKIGLIIKSKRQSNKLHLTLMNTTFQINEEERNSKNIITFDAREILKAHENTTFGETILKQIHISQLHTIGSNGYYLATAKINLLEDEPV
ncbi:activating signal cointegrator 1 complex subunit 1 isoform X1 [Bombus terrestris]|uniref:Activating signal cointegrator 1 complex subunit 1 isoform X1 n=1 Tax=Bombus terrestris TaxID=30195 RepID=A0A9C6SUZ7_BOMTE|nr:activating signal cointegrator 1 complex subunit 1 isoform X1 [Bombus terrestris]